jgi:hypothetical protein
MKSFFLYPQFQQLPDPRVVGTNLSLSEQVDANDELSLSSYLLPFECLNSQVHHICSAPRIMFRMTEVFHSHVYNIFISQ